MDSRLGHLLCAWQVIFPTIVYRQMISLIIHCITIPVGQKMTVPLNSLEIPENDVMALEASDRLIDIIWVNWRFTSGFISRPTFKLSVSLLDIMGKSKEIGNQKKTHFCRPPHIWFILGSNFQTPESTMFISTNNSMQILLTWDHTAIILLRKETRSVSKRWTYFGAKSANQSQNNSKGPCEDAGGNRYKSIYIHSKTSPIST